MVPEGLVVVSNRGPVSFRHDDSGALVARRGAGGLVSTLGPSVRGTGATWVAAALGEGDREAAADGPRDAEGYRLALLEVDEDAYRGFYDVICNRTLWFAYHGLDDLPWAPSLDDAWHEAWNDFVAVNEAFAAAVAEVAVDGATVLVHDLHLSLVGARLRALRPDLRTAHFAHTPFCWPDGLAVLPAAHRRTLLDGLAGNGACGFHTDRWANAFTACAATFRGSVPPTFVSPAAADPDDIGATASSPACAARLAELEEEVGDRAFLVRVDRMELSKNVLRGFLAYEHLLRTEPSWRGRVVFGAFCYPSREGLAEYHRYKDDAFALVARINDEWGNADWTPIHLVAEDDFPRSVAALLRADVVLVNPIRDGLNVVAKELAIVNRRDAVLCLSPEAGVWEELGHAGALEAPPFDVVGTARALHRALSMDAGERASRAAALLAAATARTPHDWLADQVAAAS